ncbi:hypothetical protein ACFS6H_05765 [Terrimonas rubra]|uniref:Uncharacterized protein n=1 Tax=Terrimonas rubra TaxID=1035890 RepID=A0ABW6A1Q3_9BACT
MNFDKLQEEWNNSNDSKIAVPPDVKKMQEAHTPIDEVRKNMRRECYIQFFCLVLMGFAPVIFNFPSQLTTVFICTYGMAVAFTLYYFYKFFKFYKHSYDLSFDSRKNLLWFYYELKLNIELYKALTYILFFIGFAFGVLAYTILKNNGITVKDADFLMLFEKKVYVIIAIIIIMALSFAGAEYWPQYYYGKHLKKIKSVLDQLDEQE